MTTKAADLPLGHRYRPGTPYMPGRGVCILCGQPEAAHRPKAAKSVCRKCSPSGYLRNCHYCGDSCDINRPFARTFVLRDKGPIHGICRSCNE